MADSHLTWNGAITDLHLATAGSEPMLAKESLRLIKGIGVDGDRYATAKGFYSHLPEPGRQITLFEVETLNALARDHDVTLHPGDHRRNVTVKGVPLNHLVGQSFWLGNALLQATRLSTPCKHIEDVTGKTMGRWLIHRSGLNCIIVKGATIHIGDAVMPMGQI